VSNYDDYDELGRMVVHEDKLAVEEWLQLGKDIDVTDEQGGTILLLALMIASFDMVSLLVNRGANINVQRTDGRSPLMQSVIAGGQCTKWLVEHGADISLRDNEGRTALDHALLWGREPAIEYLRS
jgi:ankyrin repeat protein